MRLLVAFAFAALACGCFTPDLGDGAVACGVDGLCPTDYFCHSADRHCYKTPDPADMVGANDLDGSAFANDLSSVDLAGADLSTCTKIPCGARNCGTILDGCGGTTTCGSTCPNGQTCGGGNGANKKPNVCGSGQMCQPRTCMPGQDCGLMSDGCSTVIDCGNCQDGTCGTDHTCH